MKFSAYYIPVILGLAIAIPSVGASAQVIGIGISIAPPPLPIYVQPPIPAPGYLWTPGFWSYQEEGGYYWVPGTWVRPPRIGVLWTPPYWGFNEGVYAFNAGYWGPTVGFYGGINYGFGYGGDGYGGGRWNGGNFAYNSAVNNFGSTRITNVYNERIVNNNTSRASFNGGAGGIQAQANEQQRAMAREQHIQATAEQSRQIQAARANRELRASENHGNPAIAATARPGQFHGRGVVAANDAVRGGGNGASAPGRNARVAGEHPAQAQNRENPAKGRSMAASNHTPGPRVARAPAERRAAPQQHAAAPRAQHAAPQQHAAAPRAQHAAPQQHAAAPRAQRAAPQQHAAAPRAQHAAPQQHAAAPRAQHAAPQRVAAAPHQGAAPGGKADEKHR